MNLKILVNNDKNRGFNWYSSDNVLVKGYFFDEKNNFYEKENLLKYFVNCNTKEKFVNKVKDANGLFSVIIHNKNQLFVASDIVRMFPLFYSSQDKQFIISDKIERIETGKINSFSLNEIQYVGFVSGNRTIYDEIKQVQAGELLIFENSELKTQFYYTYLTKKNEILSNPIKELETKAINIFDNIFKRLIKSLDNRTAIIPLSGGYDSRLIAVMLKKYGYKKVICYTYGARTAKDMPISENVAKKLGFEWHYIEYNKKLFGNFLEDKLYTKYWKYTSQNITVPFFQEYFAVKYLKDNKLIPNDSIFIPGHSGDFIGGSHLRGNYKNINKINRAIRIIYSTHYTLNPISQKHKRIIKHNLKCFIKNILKGSELNYSTIDDWNFKERQSKMITNSANVYNYFGYELRLPFWDLELTSFFKNVPYEYKLYKVFFNKILTKEYFSLYNLYFDFEIQPSIKIIKKQELKNKIKKLLPNFIIHKLSKKQDWLNSKLIIVAKMQEIEIKINTNKIYNSNGFLVKWFVNKISKNLVSNEKKN